MDGGFESGANPASTVPCLSIQESARLRAAAQRSVCDARPRIRLLSGNKAVGEFRTSGIRSAPEVVNLGSLPILTTHVGDSRARRGRKIISLVECRPAGDRVIRFSTGEDRQA